MKNYLLSFLKCFLIFISILTLSNIQAQKSNEVLLKLINQKTTTPDDKFEYLGEIVNHYYHLNDTIRVHHYGYQSLKIAKELKSVKKEVIAYDYIFSLASVKKEIAIADYCKILADKSKDEELIAYSDWMTAYKYDAIEDYDKYIFYMLKSLAYFEKTKTRYDKLVNSFGNVSAYFGNKNNYDVQEKYALKSYNLSLESKSDLDKARGLTMLGLTLVDNGTQKSIPDKVLLDSASTCYSKAIRIIESKKINIETYRDDYARICQNLSSLYLYYFYETRRTQTLAYIKKAEEACKKSVMPIYLIVMYGQQAQFYINRKDIFNAERLLKKIKEYIDKHPETDANYRLAMSKSFMDLAILKNDFPGYRRNYESFDIALNEMHNKDNNAAIYNTAVKFETEQKDKEIKSLTLIADERKKVNYLLIVLSLVALFSLAFMYKTFQYKKKVYLKAKSDEAISNMLELEIANREKKIAIQEKLLTEQQKQKLQQELMTNNLQLENKKEILKDIQQKLALIKTAETKQISKTINKSIEIDEEFELLKTSFENTNPIFFSSLQDKASNALTKLDLKYCGYIKLGLGTKEMANIMNIEPKSMKMARYRLRQKLNLKKEEDLDDYINSL